LVAAGPIALGEAMHEADVDVISAELAAKTLKIGTRGGGVAGPGFGEDGDLVARNVFEGFRDVRVAAIAIGGIEETQTVIVAIEKQFGKALDAESGLMRMVAHAHSAGAHGEAAGLNAGLAEGGGA